MRVCVLLGVMAAAALSGSVHAQTCDTSETHWSYKDDKTGPKCWGQILSRKYLATCEQGKRQSPVDLPNSAGALTFGFGQSWAYRDVLLIAKNTGHAIELPFRPGTTPATQMAWTIDRKDYILQQIHFHAPSEHTLAGKSYPMEAHLVHKANDGAYAVRAILFQEGAANWMLQGVLLRTLPKIGEKNLNDLLSSLTRQGIKVVKEEGGLSYADVSINPTALIPSSGRFFQYSGSLTTPQDKDGLVGCVEGVYWRVDETVMEAASNQINDIKDALGFANNRPVQAIKDHKIQKSN